jgi:nucleotide-binding universal stress UspA family protein
MIKDATLKKILLPTDFSDAALRAGELASNLARSFNADIFALHVIETAVYKTVMPELDITTLTESEISKSIENRVKQYAEELGGGTGRNVVSMFQVGTVSDIVCEAVDQMKCDLVVCGLHGVTGMKKYFAGSNAYRISVRSEAPVLSVPQGASTDIKKILLPVTDDLDTIEKAPWAALIASKTGAVVEVMGISKKHDDHAKSNMNGHVETITKFLNDQRVMFEIHWRENDDHAEAVLECSDKMKIDLICIMTDRKKSGAGIFPGGFANQILNNSKASVLTMHPGIG